MPTLHEPVRRLRNPLRLDLPFFPAAAFVHPTILADADLFVSPHVHFCRSLPCLHPPFFPAATQFTQRFGRMPPNVCGSFLLMPTLFELTDQLRLPEQITSFI